MAADPTFAVAPQCPGFGGAAFLDFRRPLAC